MAIVLMGCAAASPDPDPTRRPTTVVVQLPTNWTDPQDLRLEIGNTTWIIPADGAGGVASREISIEHPASLVGDEDCHLYAGFAAAPGSSPHPHR